ncbi:MAG: hypothetical protein OEY70_07930, partial [Acidimicrobiia bacterium]|nr:hypothetical protein [Acidimicrobiia bacterium]
MLVTDLASQPPESALRLVIGPDRKIVVQAPGEVDVFVAHEFLRHLDVDAGLDEPGGVGVVGSGRGAVPSFWGVRFLGPSCEPDVRVPSHPALHEAVSVGHVRAVGFHGVVSMI